MTAALFPAPGTVFAFGQKSLTVFASGLGLRMGGGGPGQAL